jgi:hypothetical protein
MDLSSKDLDQLRLTLSSYEPVAMFTALHEAIVVYRELREDTFDDAVVYRYEAERIVMNYVNSFASSFIAEGGR